MEIKQKKFFWETEKGVEKHFKANSIKEAFEMTKKDIRELNSTGDVDFRIETNLNTDGLVAPVGIFSYGWWFINSKYIDKIK